MINVAFSDNLKNLASMVESYNGGVVNYPVTMGLDLLKGLFFNYTTEKEKLHQQLLYTRKLPDVRNYHHY